MVIYGRAKCLEGKYPTTAGRTAMPVISHTRRIINVTTRHVPTNLHAFPGRFLSTLTIIPFQHPCSLYFHFRTCMMLIYSMAHKDFKELSRPTTAMADPISYLRQLKANLRKRKSGTVPIPIIKVVCEGRSSRVFDSLTGCLQSVQMHAQIR